MGLFFPLLLSQSNLTEHLVIAEPDSIGVHLSTALKYNFEGSVLYSSIIFGEYSCLYSSIIEREILYSSLHYISIHNCVFKFFLEVVSNRWVGLRTHRLLTTSKKNLGNTLK